MSDNNRSAIEWFVAEIEDPNRFSNAFDKLIADDVVVTDWMLPAVELRGRDEFYEKFIAPLDESFPGVRFVVDESIVADDTAVLRGNFVGTFSNDYTAFTHEPRTTIPAHGRDVKWPFHDIYRFKDGMISRIWYGNDSLLVARQLGVFPDDGNPW